MRHCLIFLLIILLISSCAKINIPKEEPIGWFNSKSKDDVLCAFDVPTEKMHEGDLEIWIYKVPQIAKLVKKEHYRGSNSREFFINHPSIQKYGQQLTFVFKGNKAYVWHEKGFELIIMKNKKAH